MPSREDFQTIFELNPTTQNNLKWQVFIGVLYSHLLIVLYIFIVIVVIV